MKKERAFLHRVLHRLVLLLLQPKVEICGEDVSELVTDLFLSVESENDFEGGEDQSSPATSPVHSTLGVGSSAGFDGGVDVEGAQGVSAVVILICSNEVVCRFSS
jgi:hypothetical protein